MDYRLQLCCDHRIQNFPKISNQQNMKIGLMSAVLIYFQLSSKKASIGPTFILGAKKRLLKFVN